MFEKPQGYNKVSENKKNKLKDLFFDDNYNKYKKEKVSTQKRKEKIAKFGAWGFIIAICTLIWIPQFISSDAEIWLLTTFGQSGVTSPNFKIWQLFTSMWLHGGFIHLAINMFVLWSFGRSLQGIWGSKKFLTLYILSGLTGSILSMTFSGIYPYNIGVGASGAICGLIGAMAVLSPDTKVLLFFFIPAQIKKTVIWFGIISLVLALTNWLPMIGHAAHLGGLIGGYLIALYWKKKGNLMTTFI